MQSCGTSTCHLIGNDHFKTAVVRASSHAEGQAELLV